jgi:hypothetical protein
LVKGAVVASYSASKATEIFTDASKDRMRACWVQEGKVVGWFSRRLKGPQLKWSMTRKEARAFIEAVRNWSNRRPSGEIIKRWKDVPEEGVSRTTPA